jgi:zinc protease
MNTELIKLKNQLNVLFINSPGSTMGSTQIWFRAGSALEEPSDHGIAHFLEHMFFKGTPKRPGAQIAHDVESFGGDINAFTSFDYTCYYINYPSTHMHESVEILLDMVSNPMFLEDDLLPERDVVHEEYRRSIDSPNQYAFMTLQQQCFTDGYQHPILGSEDHIKNFSKDQLIAFRKNYYNLENALFVVSGDLKNRDKLCKLIEKFNLPSGKQSHFPNFQLAQKPTISIHQKPVRMAQLNIAIQGAALQDSEAAAEDLAMNCLGHGETSPFYKELVLKDSLASQAVSSTLFMNHGSVHFIKIVAPVKNFPKVLQRTSTLLEKLSKKGFQEDEVQRIKNQYVASKVYEMESLEAFSFSLGHSYAQTGDISSEEQFIKSVRHTSKDQVNSAFERLLSRPFHLSAQLPEDVNPALIEKSLKDFSNNLSTLAKTPRSKTQRLKSSASSQFDPQIRLVEIKPGIQLLHRQNTMNPTFVLHGYMHGGLSFESVKTNGSFHLLAALLTKGHNKCSYEKLKQELESTSTSFNGFAGKNAYGLTMHGQTEFFPRLTEHFFNSVTAPLLPTNLFNHEKKLTLRSLEAQKEDPVRTCFQIAAKQFFGTHPYHRNILGTSNAVKEHKREDILNLHQKALKNSSMLFTYCGDLPLEDVKGQIERCLAGVLPRKPKAPTRRNVKKLPSKIQHIPFKREQTHLFHGIQIAPLAHKENLVLKMITTHLSGQSSELFVEVRDRQGLCYSAQPVHFTALEGGYWGIYMGTGNEKVDLALAAIKKILTDLKTKGLNSDEFNRVKKMIEGQALINVQTNEDFANIYSVPLFQGLGIDYYHLEIQAVQKLNHQTFNRELKTLLARSWSTITVGYPLKT